MSYTDEHDVELQDVYDEDLGPSDYGFIVGPDGQLKSVFVPNEMTEIPESVKDIFAMFGIKNPHRIYEQTIH